MLSTLIEQARREYYAAMDLAGEKFEAYMTAPYDGKDAERSAALDRAWHAMYKSEGVVAGLERAQRFLEETNRMSDVGCGKNVYGRQKE